MASKPVVPKTDPKRWTRLFSFGFEQCTPQVTIYGSCVVDKIGQVRKGVCQQEWQNLSTCLAKAMKEGGRYKRI